MAQVAFSGEPQALGAELEEGQSARREESQGLPAQGLEAEPVEGAARARRGRRGSRLEEAPGLQLSAIEPAPGKEAPPPEPSPPEGLSHLLPEAPGVEFFRPRRSRPRPPEPEKAPKSSEEARAAEPSPGSEAPEAAGASPADLRQLFERLVRTWPRPGDQRWLSASRPPEPEPLSSSSEAAPRPRVAQPENPLLDSFHRLARTWPRPGEPSWADSVVPMTVPAGPDESRQGLEGERSLEDSRPPSPAREPPHSPTLAPLGGSLAASGLPQARAWLRPPSARQEASDEALAAPLAPPTPLADSARRFLEPLLGFDPSEFAVYRDPTADRIAWAHRADGVNIGQAVFLAAGQQDGDPRTLGLLAHELTHAARRREPRFVPALLRASGFQARPEDEERMAQEVEREVRDLAYQIRRDPAPAPARESPSLLVP
ncbi:DUF4157 domain-containing protein, partial [Calidithermus roseus]|uniref:eCIS core domain-containing protein n=1 Tax=Calidithermus roseus TaxID=1644118 RepID=UPI0015FAF8A2